MRNPANVQTFASLELKSQVVRVPAAATVPVAFLAMLSQVFAWRILANLRDVRAALAQCQSAMLKRHLTQMLV